MPDVTGLGPVPDYLRQRDVPIGRERLCRNGDPYLPHAKTCTCGGSGLAQPDGDVDRVEQKRLHVEEQPWDFPARSQREWSPQWGGSGPTRR